MDGLTKQVLACAKHAPAIRGVRGRFVLVLLGCSGCALNNYLSLQELLELEAALARRVPSKEPQRIPATQPIQLALPEAPYRLTPGDRVRIGIRGVDAADDADPAVFEQRISQDGNVRLPFGGDIQLGGLTLDEAERKIRETLVEREFYVEDVFKLAVTVDVLEYHMTSVFVYGEVVTPGLHRLRGNERTVVGALHAATPLREASGIVHLRSIRGRDRDARYNLHEPADLKRALTSPPLESGDLVAVEASTPNVIYFAGLVNASGPVVFAPGQRVTFLQSLAAAGGQDLITDPELALLRRRLVTGQEVVVELAIKDIERGVLPNFEMKPGDVVVVPQTFQTLVTGWLNQNLEFTAGASAHVRYDPLVERRADELTRARGADSSLTGVPIVVPPNP